MALSKSTITGRVPLPTDENLKFAELTFALSGLDTEGASVLPGGVSTRAVLVGSDIPAGFELWQNTAGLRGTHYRVLARWAVKDRDGIRDQYADLGIIQVGSDPSYTLADLINNGVPPAIGTFWSAITQAQYDAVIQAAVDAQASATAAALYDGPRVDTFAQLVALTAVDVAVGQYVQVRSLGAWYRRVASGGMIGPASTVVAVLDFDVMPGAGGYDVRALGVVGDGVADDTAVLQAAIDTGREWLVPWGNYLVTDSLEIDEMKGCTLRFEARTVPNNVAFERLIFRPATKRDIFVWKNIPASYAFAAVNISGVSVIGEGPGAAAVFNLPRLYRGRLEAYIYSGIDHYAVVERWLDCKVLGNVNGFRVSAFRLTNSTLAGDNITTRVTFDVYVSGGDPAFTTYGYDIETYAIVGGRLDGIVESVDCVIRMARGNTVDSYLYTENAPRTNAGALFEIGKINTGAPDGTTIFMHHGVNLHGRNVAAPGYNATVFADIDYCSSFVVSGCDIRRFGALLKTTVNSKNISFQSIYSIGVDLIEPTTTGIADFSELEFNSCRFIDMASPNGGPNFQYTNFMTTTDVSPQGLTRPRWAHDYIYSTASRSFWVSTGDGLFDWRLMAPQDYTGYAVVSAGTIAAGASYQSNVTVFGALGGDFAVASYGPLYPGLTVTARVTAVDTVTVTLSNVTASPIVTVAGTIRVIVTKSII